MPKISISVDQDTYATLKTVATQMRESVGDVASRLLISVARPKQQPNVSKCESYAKEILALYQNGHGYQYIADTIYNRHGECLSDSSVRRFLRKYKLMGATKNASKQ